MVDKSEVDLAGNVFVKTDVEAETSPGVGVVGEKDRLAEVTDEVTDEVTSLGSTAADFKKADWWGAVDLGRAPETAAAAEAGERVVTSDAVVAEAEVSTADGEEEEEEEEGREWRMGGMTPSRKQRGAASSRPSEPRSGESLGARTLDEFDRVRLAAALWSGTNKNRNVSTGSLTRPFARSLAPLTYLFAPPCLLC